MLSFEGLSLGRLEFEVTIQHGRLGGTFSVSGEPERNFVVGEIPELAECLSQFGYVLANIDCRVFEHMEEETLEYDELTDGVDWVV